MVRKRVTADVDTDELQPVVKTRLATNILTAGDVLNQAVAYVGAGGGTFNALIEDPDDPGTYLIGGA